MVSLPLPSSVRWSESWGGATWTPPYPDGPRTVVHSCATDGQFHSNRLASTSRVDEVVDAVGAPAALADPVEPVALRATTVTSATAPTTARASGRRGGRGV